MTPEERLDRIENGIRDLIRVSSTVLQAQQRTGENIDALVEHQQVIDQKLLELTGTVTQLTGTVTQLAGTVTQLSGTVERLAAKVDKLSDTVDAFIKGLHKPNGNL